MIVWLASLWNLHFNALQVALDFKSLKEFFQSVCTILEYWVI